MKFKFKNTNIKGIIINKPNLRIIKVYRYKNIFEEENSKIYNEILNLKTIKICYVQLQVR